MPVEPDGALDVAVPAVAEPVVPAVDPVGVDADELPDELAFVRMNDAAFPLSDVERDVPVAAVEVPAVDPVVPTAPLAPLCCRQPVTVIVLAGAELFAPLCCGSGVVCPVGVCAPAIATELTPIARIQAARFMKPPFPIVRRVRLQGCRHWRPHELW